MTPGTHPTFNIWHSERRPADPAAYRLDLCVGIGPDQAINPDDGTVRIGEERRDFPPYCQRFFLDTPALGTAAELFLPLK